MVSESFLLMDSTSLSPELDTPPCVNCISSATPAHIPRHASPARRKKGAIIILFADTNWQVNWTDVHPWAFINTTTGRIYFYFSYNAYLNPNDMDLIPVTGEIYPFWLEESQSKGLLYSLP